MRGPIPILRGKPNLNKHINKKKNKGLGLFVLQEHNTGFRHETLKNDQVSHILDAYAS